MKIVWLTILMLVGILSEAQNVTLSWMGGGPVYNSIPPVVLTNALIAYYTMDDPAGTEARTNLVNPALYLAFPVGTAYSASGLISTSVDCTNQDSNLDCVGLNVSTNTAVTINWWLYSHDTNTVVDRISWGVDDGGGNKALHADLVTYSANFYVGFYVVGWDMRVTVAPDLANNPGSNWIMYTWVHSNDIPATFFTNGVLCASSSKNSTNFVPGTYVRDFYIGNSMNNSCCSARAQIDEIGIWLTNLNAIQIKALYNGGAGLRPL